MTELTTYNVPGTVGAFQPDPTGGRLVAWAEAASAANALAKALVQTTFVPAGETVGNATAKILMGDEVGLSPLASLRSIYVVHGTPAMYARSMVALALSHGHQVWTEETSDKKVVVCGQRRGSEHVERSEWTIERARTAGYTNNKKYASTPQEMLYAKAAGEVARKIAADALAGIPHSVEDIELEQPAPTTTVTRGAVTTTPVKRQRAKAPEPVEPEFTEPVAEVTDAPELPAEDEPEPLTDKTRKQMFALLNDAGITDPDVQRQGMSKILGRPIASRSELTEDDARTVILELQARAA